MGWLIGGIMFSLLFILVVIPQPGIQSGASDNAAKIFVFIITLAFFAKYRDVRMGGKEKRKKAKELKTKENFEKASQIPGTKERMQKLEASAHVAAIHIAGLPVPEGADFHIYLREDEILFERNESEYYLMLEKITDITIKTDIEIQNSYVSSVGGAVGGAVLFGPLGAMVGGRAKKKTDKKINQYLIFAYDEDDNTNFISFDVTDKPDAKGFTEFFNSQDKKKKSVIL